MQYNTTDAHTAIIQAIVLSMGVASNSVAVGDAGELCPRRPANPRFLFSTTDLLNDSVTVTSWNDSDESTHSELFALEDRDRILADEPRTLSFSILHGMPGKKYFIGMSYIM